MPPVRIDMRAMEMVYPNGQVSPFVKIAIPMPVDCALAERNQAYLYRTTDLSPAQCDRMGVVMASYLVEILI